MTDTVTAHAAGGRTNTSSDLVVQRVPETWPSSRALGRLRGRDFATVTLLVVDAMAGILVAADLGGPVRIALGLTASLTVPGWAVVAQLDLRWPAAEVALTLATSLAVLLVISQLMISLRVWHPSAAWSAVSGLSAVLLIARLARPREGAGGS